MKGILQIIGVLAITSVVASSLVSCGSGLGKAEAIDLSKSPVQTVNGMFAVQTRNGEVTMRLEAPLMEKYETDTLGYEAFPEGIKVFGYTEDGLLETIIVSDAARHETPKNKFKDEIWEAYGNVVIHNVIKRQTMETDTIFWDRTLNEIYTDCYVKMYSPDGLMQGYGMRSDDHARNAVLLNPFNSYGVSQQDTTEVVMDSVNFIGPFIKK